MIDTCKPDDVPELARMLRALNQLHVQHLPEQFHDHGQQTELENFFREQIANGAGLLCYRIEGLPRGYVLWQTSERGDDPLRLGRKRAQLDHIYLDPILRRRGIGRRMIAAFEAQVQEAGCDSWFSFVYEFNQASNALMRNAGAAMPVNRYEKPL